MQDETKGASATKTKSKRKPRSEAAVASFAPLSDETLLERTQVARALSRWIWMEDWIEANPDKTGAEREAAWQAVRHDVMAAELKKMRRVVNNLIRHGYTLSAPEKTAKVEAKSETVA